ncbi:MAG TPA: LLM class flavin-dependent oxidoreductase [Ktedonobacterales bacterium]|jgi:alkanesulfonate monooxygenase SsuD/methylene tetrahydromethanopterin reductase-like flavin-dependent oxidoreductase (luciferase family)
MRIGVGLPSTIPGAPASLTLDWARRADAGPFSTLATLDRLAYDSLDSLIALAAVAAITTRVRVATNILVSPLYAPAALAKAAASLDALSGGRFTLGIAVGAREEDYDAAGVSYAMRGRRLVEQLDSLRDLWEEGRHGPRTERPAGPQLLLGGTSDQAFARVARYADGYAHGGGPPRAFARAAAKACAAWEDLGRLGAPLLWGQAYFSLGEEHAEAGRAYLRDYYAFTGPYAERIAAGLLTTPQAIAQFVRGYEDAGCDELILYPAVADLAQLDQLAEVVARLVNSETLQTASVGRSS